MKFGKNTGNSENESTPQKLSIKGMLDHMERDYSTEQTFESPLQQHDSPLNASTCDVNSVLSSNDHLEDHPTSVMKHFNKKNFLANFDWHKILVDIKPKVAKASIIILALTLLVSWYVSSVWDSKVKYSATSRLLFHDVKDRSRQILPETTAIKMISNKNILNKVIADNKLEMTSHELAHTLKVRLDSKSHLVGINVQNKNKDRAVVLANKLAEMALNENKEFYRKYFYLQYQNIMKQLALTETYLLAQEKTVVNFMNKNGISNAKEQYRIYLEGISRQERYYLEAQMDLEQYNIEMKILENEYLKMPDEVVRNAYEDNPLKARLTNSKLALLDAQITYGEDNPNVKIIQDSIDKLQKQLNSQDIKSTLQKVYMPNIQKQQLKMEILRKKGLIDSQLKRQVKIKDDIKNRHVTLSKVPQKQLSVENHIRKKVALEKLLETLRQKANTAEISMKSKTTNLSFYESATTASEIKPTKYLALPVGAFLFSSFLAVFFIGVIELKDSYIRTKKQLKIHFNIPCATVIPDKCENNLNSIREIASFIKHTEEHTAIKTLAFSSCKSNAGKTSLSKRSARYFHELGLKVMVLSLDCDEKEFASKKVKELTSYLNSNESYKPYVYRDHYDQLYCTYSSELDESFKTKRFEGLWTSLKIDYDLVIIDLPCLSKSTLSLDILERTDFNFFIIDSPHNKLPQLERCFKYMETRQCQPQGLILNKVSQKFMKEYI
jgi:capsular polysaccharide biosynthesis protein